MDRYKGYTLIELVVVLALFSILFSIAIPNLRALSNYEEMQELREFRRNILYARNQAIVTGEIHIMNFDYTRNFYNITVNSKPIQSYYFKKGIKLSKYSSIKTDDLGAKEFVFGRNGVPTVSGTVYLSLKNGEEFQITVTPATGKVSLKEID